MGIKPPHRLLYVALLLGGGTSCAADVVISGRVAHADGKGIEQAIVFVQSPVEPSPGVAPSPAVMDQVNKTFVPGLLPIVAGTQVKFPNRDNIRHHVYSFSRPKNFELPLYKGEEAPPVLFDKPGVVKIGCNIHDWMSAIILVVPNRHYAMTDADGKFTLAGLPPGTYTIVAWHAQSRDKTDATTKQVVLSAASVDIDFKLSLTPVKSRPAVRGARWEQ